MRTTSNTLGNALLLAALTTAVAASTASAQAHRRAAGDTLRFMQTSKMTQSMEGEAVGSMTTSINTDSRILLAFGAGDTITSWIDSAQARMSGPTGDAQPDMSQLLNRKQVATLSPKGDLVIVTAASMTPEMGAMNDMSPKTVFGLELPLPAEPLRKGTVWADTMDMKSAEGAPGTFHNRGVNRFVVVGDSTIAGRAVHVIESEGDATTNFSIPVPQMPGAIASGEMTSAVKGRMYYAPELGLLLRRAITTTTKGSQMITGDMTMSMNVAMTNEEVVQVIQH